MTREDFIAKVVTELLKDGFNILLKQNHRVSGLGGYFECVNKDFSVALKNPSSFEIFIHEYCHYLQWKENPDKYSEEASVYSDLFSWLKGEQVKGVNRFITGIVKNEHDCETRAVKLIGELNLDVDLSRYQREASTYLFFYMFVKKYRSWSRKSIYTNKKIVDCLPSIIQPLKYYLDINNIPKTAKDEFHKMFR